MKNNCFYMKTYEKPIKTHKQIAKMQNCTPPPPARPMPDAADRPGGGVQFFILAIFYRFL